MVAEGTDCTAIVLLILVIGWVIDLMAVPLYSVKAHIRDKMGVLGISHKVLDMLLIIQQPAHANSKEV